MKTKAICSFFVLFAIVAGMVSITPAAFADHSEVTIVTVDGSGFGQDCAVSNGGEGCYSLLESTVDVGGKVIFSNPDQSPHTFTAGTLDGFNQNPSGEFDTSILMQDESGEWIPDAAGEVPYYCSLHVWMTGTIIVQEAEAEEEESTETEVTLEEEIAVEETMEEEAVVEETMEAEEVMVDIVTGTAEAGEMLSIDVTFTTISGDSVEHVNYDIKATQNDEVVLDDIGIHDHDGVMNHMTSALSNAASDDAPIEVEVMFNGYGIPGEGDFTGPVGQVATTQVVPEFGTIAMMILAVAIISIVAVTAKSRVVPRF